MCELIYNIYNITIWSCPQNIICTNNIINNQTYINNLTYTTSPINQTINNQTYSPSPFDSPSPIDPGNTNQSINNQTYQTYSPSPFDSPSPIDPGNTNQSINNQTYSPSPFDSPSPIDPGNTNQSINNQTYSPSPKQMETITTPKPRIITRLRHINVTIVNQTNRTVYLNRPANYCEPDLRWLHLLWIIPFISIVVAYIFFKRRLTPKIKNIFVAKNNKYMKRSLSWPRISDKSPINHRYKSEPAFDSIVL